MPTSKIDKATNADIKEWADNYTLPNVEEALDELRDRLTSAIVNDFHAHFVTDTPTLLIHPDSDEPGVITAAIGGEDSDITPHELIAGITMNEFVNSIIEDNTINQALDHINDHLTRWRDCFHNAARKLDRELKKQNKKP